MLSFLTGTGNISVEIYSINFTEALTRVLVVTLVVEAFLLALGSYVVLVGTIFESYAITFFIVFATMLLYAVVPLPDWFLRNFFLRGLFIHDALAIYEFQVLEFTKYLILFLIYTAVFLTAGSLVFKRKQI